MIRRAGPIVCLLVAWGCGKDVCHEPATASSPGMGDANADGAVDVSDALYVERWLYASGPAPACEAGVDVLADGVVDAQDGVSIFRHAIAGGLALPTLADGACADSTPPSDDLECGAFTFQVDAPARATGDFDATVQLLAPDLGVEGWQVGVAAEGCSIEAATLDGTVGAPTTAGGARRTGFGSAAPTSGGAVSGVALDWIDDTQLDPSGDARAILALRVKASPPSSGCQPCTLSFVDTEAGTAGVAVRNVVSRKGRSWRPTTKSEKVNVCAG